MYLRVLQTFLSQLPVSTTGTNCQDATSDSEEEDEAISKMMTTHVSINELPVKKYYNSIAKERPFIIIPHFSCYW